MPLIVVGVMGPGEGATAVEQERGYQLGRAIAIEGWALVTGGRNVGVMDAASRGAKDAGGLTIGILPSANRERMSLAIDIPIVTGLGEARNLVNILSSQIVFACGMGAGTASEVSLAIKARRPVILLSPSAEAERFFAGLNPSLVHVATDVADAISTARRLLE